MSLRTRLSDLFDAYLGRQQPFDERLWHPWNSTSSVRLVDGTLWSHRGKLWRRRTTRGWEYQADPEGEDDWLQMQI